MGTLCILIASVLAQGEVDTLRFHLERLHAIPVSAELEAEKVARLDAVEVLLDANDKPLLELYQAVDVERQWLWANASEQPTTAPGETLFNENGWRITTPDLELSLAREDLAMTVTVNGHTWSFESADRHDMVYARKGFSLADARRIEGAPLNTGYSVGLDLTLAEFEEMPGLILGLGIHVTGTDVVFEIAGTGGDADLTHLDWPKAPVLPNTADVFSVIPRMQGMLLPGNWPQKINGADLANSRTLYMPWWGQIQNGHGIQCILETSDDAGVEYQHPEGGPTRITPRWCGSLGRLGYLRRLRYCFSENAGYVSMAKRYRQHVLDSGDFVSLAEKRVATPALDEVIGKPVIHIGALYHFVPEASLYHNDYPLRNHSLQTFDQIREKLLALKDVGIDDAYVHLDGWGYYGYDNGHPDAMPVGYEQGGWDGLRNLADTCDEIGYLMAVHDQYRDFYYNAVSFDDRLTATRLDGSREEHSTWCGGPQTILSPRFAPDYVRRNHDLFAEHGIKVRGAYLDVFAVVPLEESNQPTQPVTRSECAEYRRDCFDLLKARGYVVSSEEPADYLIKTLHLFHHGPYYCQPAIDKGDAPGIAVPLLNLVYHDSILLPWSMSESGGWGIPESDAGFLHCLLNAGLPYVGAGMPFQGVDVINKEIARVNEAADLAQRCGQSEMVNHEFLDDTYRKQRTTFANGTQVTVDFDAKTYTIEHNE